MSGRNPAGRTACAACSPGKYTGQSLSSSSACGNKEQCIACAPGLYVGSSAAHNCSACPPGSKQDAKGARLNHTTPFRFSAPPALNAIGWR